MFASLFRPLPPDSLNVKEKVPVGTIMTILKAVDRDEKSNITYAFAKPQTVFGLDPSR